MPLPTHPQQHCDPASLVIFLHVPLQGTVFEFGDVFCFTNFLSGFLLRVRGRVRVKVGVGGGFRVRVRASVRAR